MNVRYFEVDLSNHDGDSYSICIKATHVPTKEEVEKFLVEDMKNLGYTDVTLIVETTLEESKEFYAMENEKDFPVLN